MKSEEEFPIDDCITDLLVRENLNEEGTNLTLDPGSSRPMLPFVNSHINLRFTSAEIGSLFANINRARTPIQLVPEIPEQQVRGGKGVMCAKAPQCQKSALDLRELVKFGGWSYNPRACHSVIN